LDVEGILSFGVSNFRRHLVDTDAAESYGRLLTSQNSGPKPSRLAIHHANANI